MATDVLKVSGDYLIRTAPLGTLTLDVGGAGASGGTVVVNGNLTVTGETTTIESQNASITDNIIILNSGEPGIGVTLGTSGLRVARGNANSEFTSADLLYDDTFTHVFPYGTVTGLWSFGTENNPGVGRFVKAAGMFLPTIINTFTFFGSYNPSGVISVAGTTDYENNVLDDDHIPNKKYVDNLLGSTTFAEKLKVGNSAIEINDHTISTSSQFYNATDRILMSLSSNTNVVLRLEGTAATFNGITLVGNKIQARSTNTNLVLEATGDGVVEVSSGLQLLKTYAIASTASHTGLYSTSTVGGGGTGLYYVNTNNTDELVSRRRSIIYGIIF